MNILKNISDLKDFTSLLINMISSLLVSDNNLWKGKVDQGCTIGS